MTNVYLQGVHAIKNRTGVNLVFEGSVFGVSLPVHFPLEDLAQSVHAPSLFELF